MTCTNCDGCPCIPVADEEDLPDTDVEGAV